MRAKTMGQAIDAVIEYFYKLYPHSEVYSASVAEGQLKDNMWRVELHASHFSQPLVFMILQD